MDFLRKNAKALAGLAAAALAAYFTPEMVDEFGQQAGEVVRAGVVASLTALAVWLMPNKR